MTKKPMLLKSPNEKTLYRIRLDLQGQRTAEFVYSDRTMAREHYAEITALGVIGGVAVKHHTFDEYAEKT